MFDVPDNYDQWEAHQNRLDGEEQRLPKCACCENHIQQDMAVCIDGYWLCDTCLDIHRTEVQID